MHKSTTVNSAHTKEKIPAACQEEDAALKTMMQFFAEELLPYFGITGKVAGFAPHGTGAAGDPEVFPGF